MNRFFLDVRYKGTYYAGFQKQQNANTIQSEIESALQIFFNQPVDLTGSSRTDSGVHALQNFFHFDIDQEVNARIIYNINSLLPDDICINRIIPVEQHVHCRFDAIARSYEYRIYHKKDPFLQKLAYYFPYRLDFSSLQEASAIVLKQHNFISFSKKNSQVNHFECKIFESEWEQREQCLVYKVRANRFLRGMVRGLTGTMLQVARKKLTISEFSEIFEKGNNYNVHFSVPGHGLYLIQVYYPEELFRDK